jgi:phosphate transport system substrate-binding protein
LVVTDTHSLSGYSIRLLILLRFNSELEESPILTSTNDVIMRKPGISRTIFIVSLIVVGGVSGVTGYLINGYLHPAPPGITLNGAGSTFIYPVLSAMGTNYSRTHLNVYINYQAVGSGTGVTDLTNKIVDFGASDFPLSDAQRTNAPNVLHIPATIGAVVLAYNVPGLSTGLHLDAPTIAGIFQGSIVKWNDLAIQNINQGVVLPNQNITTVHRADSSGTTFVFTGWLNSTAGSGWNPLYGQSKSWLAPGGKGAPQNQGVASAILTFPYTIGYVESAYAIQNHMSQAYVKNIAGTYVEPTLVNATYAVTNSTGSLPAGDQSWKAVNLLNKNGVNTYPIVSFSYVLVYKDLSVLNGMTLDKAKALVDFLWFIVHNGQALSSNLDYVVLPPQVVTIDETSIQSITFNGQTLPT